MSKKPKFETQSGDRVISEDVALQERLALKAKASVATIADFVEFFMSHDGTPPQDFVIRVRTSPVEMAMFVTNLEDLLSDPSYAEDYFSATGMILNVCESHARSWAEQIASAVLEKSPTLQ